MEDIDFDHGRLIDSLVKSGYLRSPEIISAMKAEDRRWFLPEEQQPFAYEDKPLSIGFDQTASQPLVMAFMMELLMAKKGDRVLDVGTGSGWQTAVLARLVGDEGKVVTVERIPELYAFAKDNLDRSGHISEGIIDCILGDASSYSGPEKVFDRIIATAEAEEVPSSWKSILAVGGRMVIPVKGSLLVVDKVSADSFESKEYIGFGFVPLIVGKKK
ncbi:MAG: methyltransferase domain-containing protein [Candidatus Colwellbacteria bacterium]|nr:methyltransferase domain-containing protein [Candidatus Colwellbacteria bacterium]